MLEENVREWTREWLEQGIEQGRAEGLEQGIEQGRAEGLEQSANCGRCSAVRRRGSSMPARPRGWPPRSPASPDPDRLARVGEWIVECATASELLARVRGDNGSGG